jgi:8-oxo-dGTP pyrophosphatase MutT (NUDIX family)
MREWIESRRAAASAGPSGAAAAPAATVVILRDGDDGLEVLLGRRSSKLAFHGGAWVFPGGRVDPDDYGGDSEDVVAAARRAAVREAREEAGVEVDAGTLVHVSNWTTPDISPKRFATWFFAAVANTDDAPVEQADGVETEVVAWFRPADAIAARERGEIELAPPQYVTLLMLVDHATATDALAAIAREDPYDFQPRFQFRDDGGAVCLYTEDVAYDDATLLDDSGPRHRLVMDATAGS